MNRLQPKYLFDCLDAVREQLTHCAKVGVFLDLDGTLASITKTPSMTRLKPNTRLALRALAHNERYCVTVVSGREMHDLKGIVKLSGITYAGNHGLEIAGTDFEFLHSGAKQQVGLITEICGTLTSRLQSVKGAIVEFKGLSASVHYRLVAKHEIERVRAVVHGAVEPFGSRFHITEGKRVLELRPAVPWNKGSAVKWILNKTGMDQPAAIYVGDDMTDEDAFRALPKSVTVNVGNQNTTAARYFVKSPEAVLAFLEYLPLIEESSRIPARKVLHSTASS